MSYLQTQLPIDTWVDCAWNEFMQIVENQVYEKAKFYYHNGQLRIEMPPVGSDHADDNGIIVILVNLFGIAKNLPINYTDECDRHFGCESE